MAAEYTIESKALHVNLEIEQGATFDPVITYKDNLGNPIDNTGWTAKMQIVDSDTGFVVDTLTELDGLILGGTSGTITFDISKARNIAYQWTHGVYDLFLNSGTKDYKILYGSVAVIPRVTT